MEDNHIFTVETRKVKSGTLFSFHQIQREETGLDPPALPMEFVLRHQSSGSKSRNGVGSFSRTEIRSLTDRDLKAKETAFDSF